MNCLTPGCERARIEPVNGVVHAHCTACEARLLREAFGPQSWHDRARVNELPALVVGGLALDAPSGAGSAVFPERSPSPRQGATVPAAVQAA